MGISSFSSLGQNIFLRNQINLIQGRLKTEEFRISSGYKSPDYSGLGIDTRKLINFQRQTQNIESYQKVIATVDTRMTVEQESLTQIQEIAADIRAKYLQLQPELETDASVRDIFRIEARAAIEQINRLLNVQIDGRYLFSGGETQTAPMIDAGDTATAGTPLGDFFTQVNAYTGGTPVATVIANVDTYFDAITPWYQGQNPATTLSARVDEGVDVDYGVAANADAFREILKGLYYFATVPDDPTRQTEYFQLLDQGQTHLETGLGTTISRTPTVAVAAVQDISQIAGALGTEQQKMERIRLDHENALSLLEREIGHIQDADVAESISLFTQLQTQLEATFQITSSVNGLSLTNFL